MSKLRFVRPLAPKHFDGKRFYNPDGVQARGLRELPRWKLTSRAERSPRWVDDVEPSKPPASVADGELRVTFINHSAVLLQLAGIHILTDPIWSMRASPFIWAGPRRRRAPGVRFEDLPRIDLVLLSHNHYDHLDISTLKRLSQAQFVVPSGVAKLVRSTGANAVRETDWGEHIDIDGTRIHAVAAHHSSARSVLDRNRSLWCGYMIESAIGLLYFAGDTGFACHFEQISEHFGPPRLALLPIGAYLPRWFMAPVHMTPADAVHVHRLLGAQTSIAIHHGTFQLADEGLDTPRKELLACSPGNEFLVLDNGQSVTLR
jgi:L-ascorbate metabolism protein UlaG (beta-lactamase superfamily)